MVIRRHYRLQKKLLCVLEILFLGTFDKKALYCTWHCWKLLIIILTLDCLLQYTQYICYLFLHSRGHIHMGCLLVYLDTESIYRVQDSKGKLERLLTWLYVHSCHIPFSESYYGLQNVTTLWLWFNKILIEDYISTSAFFHSMIHSMSLKLSVCVWIYFTWYLSLQNNLHMCTLQFLNKCEIGQAVFAQDLSSTKSCYVQKI